MVAGARRVIVSLWPVDDEASALFMGEFYRALFGASRFNPVQALRLARTALWRNPRWNDPKYWSAFVLEGDWAPLAVPGGLL
jgi:CHAT domain-containing protein